MQRRKEPEHPDRERRVGGRGEVGFNKSQHTLTSDGTHLMAEGGDGEGGVVVQRVRHDQHQGVLQGPVLSPLQLDEHHLEKGLEVMVHATPARLEDNREELGGADDVAFAKVVLLERVLDHLEGRG